VHLGEPAGRAIADLVFTLAARVEALERSKVDVMPVIRENNKHTPHPIFSHDAE
jgi:hypothetical protein